MYSQFIIHGQKNIKLSTLLHSLTTPTNETVLRCWHRKNQNANAKLVIPLTLTCPCYQSWLPLAKCLLVEKWMRGRGVGVLFECL